MTAALALLASLALHLGLFLYLQAGGRTHLPVKSPAEISVEIKTVERPQAPPPPEPPKPEKLPAKKVPRLVARLDKPPPQPPTPPPPNQTPPKDPPKNPPPVRIGINLDSTAPAGEFAAPVGNTLYGQAPEKAPAPTAAAPLPAWTQNYVAPARVAELPVLLSEEKPAYPPPARKEGIEGQVVLLLTIDEHGAVVRVKRVAGPGHGLDEAAIAAAKQFRFKPARYNGAAVATEIRYVYTFEID